VNERPAEQNRTQRDRDTGSDVEGIRRRSLLDLDEMRTVSAACRFSSHVLAEHLGVSARQLHRLFVASFGCPPQRWLREQRLQLALRTLLARSERAPTLVKEVAFEMGYQHPTQFSRDFRNRFGFTPLEVLAAVAPRAELNERSHFVGDS